MREAFNSSVICMVIPESIMSLCMAVITKKYQKRQGSFPIFCLNSANISALTIHVLVSKKVKRPLQEWPYSKNLKM
jgi:hypothetical protein